MNDEEQRAWFADVVAKLHAARIISEQHPAAIMVNDTSVSTHTDISICGCVAEAVALLRRANDEYDRCFSRFR